MFWVTRFRSMLLLLLASTACATGEMEDAGVVDDAGEGNSGSPWVSRNYAEMQLRGNTLGGYPVLGWVSALHAPCYVEPSEDSCMNDHAFEIVEFETIFSADEEAFAVGSTASIFHANASPTSIPLFDDDVDPVVGTAVWFFPKRTPEAVVFGCSPMDQNFAFGVRHIREKVLVEETGMSREEVIDFVSDVWLQEPGGDRDGFDLANFFCPLPPTDGGTCVTDAGHPCGLDAGDPDSGSLSLRSGPGDGLSVFDAGRIVPA